METSLVVRKGRFELNSNGADDGQLQRVRMDGKNFVELRDRLEAWGRHGVYASKEFVAPNGVGVDIGVENNKRRHPRLMSRERSARDV